MNLKLKQNANLILGLNSFVINYFPYIIFILLINRQGSIVSNVLPLAIFYAFRRTALFIFRDFRKNSILLGWIGLTLALVGYLIGIFGVISVKIFDLAAIFAGSAAAIFPTSLKQTKRQFNEKKKKGIRKPGLTIVVLLSSMIIFALIAKLLPTLSFLLLFVITLGGMVAYKSLYGFESAKDIRFNLPNAILVGILLVAMFLMEKGRNQNSGSMVEWGVFLLAVFLLVLLLILIFDHDDHFAAASKETYFQISMYGACAMFWITYSAILITITHGAAAFYFIFLVYLAAIILAKPVVQLVTKFIPGDQLTINSLMIILGILCTFWFPSYFVGVFLIRVFASNQKQIAFQKYEEETNNTQDSYFLSYYLTSLSAFLTQTIMWVTLIICCKPAGLTRILHDITFHQLATDYLGSINLTHLVLAGAMIIYVVITYWISNRESNN